MQIDEIEDWGEQWREVEFQESVKLIGIIRGRSAAHFEAYSQTTASYYTIFMTDFLDMAINGDVKGTEISGIFKVMKKGQNFGIRLKDTPKRKKHKYVYPHNSPIPGYI